MKHDIDFLDEIEQLDNYFPYVLIDTMTELLPPEKGARGKKCASYSEPYYTGHFPNQPIMPGVLILMAFSQMVSVLSGDMRLVPERMEKIRFRQPVVPGQTLLLTISEEEGEDPQRKIFRCSGEVEEKECVRAKLYFRMPAGDAGEQRRH